MKKFVLLKKNHQKKNIRFRQKSVLLFDNYNIIRTSSLFHSKFNIYQKKISNTGICCILRLLPKPNADFVFKNTYFNRLLNNQKTPEILLKIDYRIIIKTTPKYFWKNHLQSNKKAFLSTIKKNQTYS